MWTEGNLRQYMPRLEYAHPMLPNHWSFQDVGSVCVAVCGRARSGKGSVKAWLQEHTGLRSDMSTSEFYWSIVMGRPMSKLAKLKESAHGRKQLTAEIDAYNAIGASGCRLYACMKRNGHTIIDGIRRLLELRACAQERVTTHLLWVDADERLESAGVPPDTTLDYTASEASICFSDYSRIDNNGDPAALAKQLRQWCLTRGVPLVNRT